MSTPFPPEGAVSPVRSVTPGRQTRAVFDLDETIQVEEGINVLRMGREVAIIAARDNASDSRFHQNTRPWLSGAWTLAPRQENTFQEINHDPFVFTPSGGTGLIGLVATVATNVVALAIWKKNGGAGITYDPSVANNNADVFLQREVDETLDDAWIHGALALPAPFAALPAALPTQTTAQICFYHAQEVQRADQGYCLRFMVQGTQAHVPDTIGVFYFGGTDGGTNPQYALVLRGSGDAQLWEYGKLTAGSSAQWRICFQFSFAKRGLVSGHTHQILVYPLVSPHGEKFIHFAGLALDTSETSAAGVGSVGDSAGMGGGATGLTEDGLQNTKAACPSHTQARSASKPF